MKKPESMRDINPFGLRLPADLRRSIEEAATNNHRSMNAEIVARLQESFLPREANELSLAKAQAKAFVMELSMLSSIVALTNQLPPSEQRDELLDSAIDRFDAMGDVDQRLKDLIKRFPVDTDEAQS